MNKNELKKWRQKKNKLLKKIKDKVDAGNLDEDGSA